MKKIVALSFMVFSIVFLAGCGQQQTSQTKSAALAPEAQQLNQQLETNSQPPQMDNKNVTIPTEFFAMISATDLESMNEWNNVASKDGVSMKDITKVKAGQETFFPLVFARYSLDKNGKGKVSAQITLTNPNGKVILDKKYDNIVRSGSAGCANSGYCMIPEVSGDNFTSSDNPKNYPLGKYILKAVVKDEISGKTIEDLFEIEKVQ